MSRHRNSVSYRPQNKAHFSQHGTNNFQHSNRNRPDRHSNTTPKVSLTVTRVRCILGIKNDGNIDGMIKTQERKQKLPLESPVAD